MKNHSGRLLVPHQGVPADETGFDSANRTNLLTGANRKVPSTGWGDCGFIAFSGTKRPELGAAECGSEVSTKVGGTAAPTAEIAGEDGL